jgi:hypothetical protein
MKHVCMVHAVVAAVDIECQIVFSFSRIVPHPQEQIPRVS